MKLLKKVSLFSIISSILITGSISFANDTEGIGDVMLKENAYVSQRISSIGDITSEMIDESTCRFRYVYNSFSLNIV